MSKTSRPSKIVPRFAGDDAVPVKRKKGRTAEEVEHQSKVAALGCIVCALLGELQETRTEIHHVRQGRRRDDSHMDVLPLCFKHHRGRFSIHGDKSSIRATGKTDVELLDEVQRMLGEQID